MVEVLQILLVLILISLIGIILGYLIGKLSCKRVQNDYYFEKNEICESKYSENVAKNESKFNSNENIKNDNVEIIEDKIIDDNTNSSTQDISKEETEDSLKDTKEQKKNYNNINSSKDEAIELKSSQNELINQESKLLSDIEEDKLETTVETNTSNIEEENLNSDNTIINKNDANLSKDKESKNLDLTKNSSIEQKLLTSTLEDKKPDNLCKIKGIGRVIESKLNDNGIYYFEQIAKWSEEDINFIDKHLLFKGRILREDWINQAKLLALGEETEFSKRVEKGEVDSSKK